MKTSLHLLCWILLSASLLAQDPGADEAVSELSNQAKAEYAGENYAAAIELYREIVKKHPYHRTVQAGDVQLRLIQALRQADRIDEAVREAKTFVDSFPEHRSVALAYYTLGFAYERLGMGGAGAEKAREAYLKALETERSPQMISTLKKCLANLDRKLAEDAVEQRELMQANPDRAIILSDPLPSEEGLPRKDGLGSYVILTDVAKDDPYYKAVGRLEKLRKVKAVVPFAADKMADLSDRLKEISPEFVCVVVKPETIDANFACRLLELGTRLDSDPFPDFVFGIITGRTPEEADAFVRNIAKMEKHRASFPRKLLRVNKMSSTSEVREDMDEWATGFSCCAIRYDTRSFLDRHLPKLVGNGIISIYGSGSPLGVTDGLEYGDLFEQNLFPAVVFSSTSYTGVTSKSLSVGSQSYKVMAEDLDPSRSFCLKVIASGATGYVAPVGPVSASLATSQEIERLVRTGECLGRVLKYTYDGVVLMRRESVLSFPPLVPGKRRPPDTRLDSRMRSAASRVLYGDPAYQPFTSGIGRPTKIATKKRSDALRISCRRTAEPEDREYCLMDAYRVSVVDEKRRNNDQLRFAVELPKGFDREIKGVTVENMQKREERLRPSFVTCIQEKWGGRRLLHVQLDLPPLSIREQAFAVDVVLELAK